MELIDFTQYSEAQLSFILWAFLTGTLLQWFLMGEFIAQVFKRVFR